MSDASRNPKSSKRYFTSHEAAGIFQVNPSSVLKWINDGLLPSFRTPGGHRRIGAGDLAAFARRHGMPVPPALAALAATRVLLAGADPQLARRLAKALGPLDGELALDVADAAIDTLVHVGATLPDVLVLDVDRGLPGLDPFEVLDDLGENPLTHGLQILALGAESAPATAAEFRAHGAAHYLPKPVAVPALVERLRELRRGGPGRAA